MKQTFESAVTRIEEISKLLEDKNISLDDSIKLFEEGTLPFWIIAANV